MKSYTSNCINNHDENIYELRIRFLLNKNPNDNNISENDRELMRKISIVFGIKSKLFKEKYISFKEVLEKVWEDDYGWQPVTHHRWFFVTKLLFI